MDIGQWWFKKSSLLQVRLLSKLKFKVAREIIPGLTAVKDGMSIMNSQGWTLWPYLLYLVDIIYQIQLYKLIPGLAVSVKNGECSNENILLCTRCSLSSKQQSSPNEHTNIWAFSLWENVTFSEHVKQALTAFFMTKQTRSTTMHYCCYYYNYYDYFKCLFHGKTMWNFSAI